MSFPGSKQDAHNIIFEIEESPTHGYSDTSKIRDGVSSPGGAAAMAKPAKETQQVGRLRAGINKPHTATDGLRRKYTASGSNK